MALFPIKEKADARTGLRLLTDSCKDEQWDCPASQPGERKTLYLADTTLIVTATKLCLYVFYGTLL